MKEINVMLGKRIKEIRNSKNVTREKLSEIVEVSPRFLADVEGGRVGVSIETLKKLCETLEVTADFLLGISDEPIKYFDTFNSKILQLDRVYYPIVLNLINGLI